MKVYINGQGHMTKMSAMAINSKNLLLQNQKAYDFETSGNGALQSLFINHDPGMTLTYFTARSTLVAHALEWGKLVKCS